MRFSVGSREGPFGTAPLSSTPPCLSRKSAPLTEAMAINFVSRQVFDLPEPQPLIVTEHRAHGCRCAACGSQTRAGFPAEGKCFGLDMRTFSHYIARWRPTGMRRLRKSRTWSYAQERFARQKSAC